MSRWQALQFPTTRRALVRRGIRRQGAVCCGMVRYGGTVRCAAVRCGTVRCDAAPAGCLSSWSCRRRSKGPRSRALRRVGVCDSCECVRARVCVFCVRISALCCRRARASCPRARDVSSGPRRPADAVQTRWCLSAAHSAQTMTTAVTMTTVKTMTTRMTLVKRRGWRSSEGDAGWFRSAW